MESLQNPISLIIARFLVGLGGGVISFTVSSLATFGSQHFVYLMLSVCELFLFTLVLYSTLAVASILCDCLYFDMQICVFAFCEDITSVYIVDCCGLMTNRITW